MYETVELKELINDRENVFQLNPSRNILKEYLSFLTTDNNQEDIGFIEKDLLKCIKYECFFGKKIYSIEDIYKFYTYHKEIIYKEMKKFFLSSRDSSLLNSFYRYKNKVWHSIDIAFSIIRTHDFEQYEIFDSWVNESLKHLEGSKRDFNAKDFKNALKRMELGVETLIKAYSLYMGLKKEKDLQKDIGHFSINVYINLLNESWVLEAEDLFKVKGDIKKSIDTLHKAKPPKIVISDKDDKQIEKLKADLLDWDKTINFFIDNFKKIDYKLDKKFAKKGIKYALNRCKREFNTDIKSYYKSFLGFSGLLFPLSVITQFYQSKFSYVDFSRKININYEELNLIKHFKEIIFLLKENVSLLKKSYQDHKEFSYTLLSETLFYKLEYLITYTNKNQRNQRIKEILRDIKKDELIKYLVNKIKSSEVVTYALSEDLM